MLNYRINSDTLAIFPTLDNKSNVFEDEKEILIESSPNNIIKKNCKYFGSTFYMMLKKTELLTGDTYKAPILINYNDNIIFFPTSSPRKKTVIWINLFNIDKTYFDTKNNKTVIKFLNGKKINLDVSLNIINNQIFKATRLEHKIGKIKALNA